MKGIFEISFFSAGIRLKSVESKHSHKSDQKSKSVQVAGKVWGAGAGPAPSGYGVERINGR